VPIAYIGAAAPIGDVNRFRKICPNLITGQTIGSGHLSPLEVPDQINPMLERFVEVYAAKGENRPSASPNRDEQTRVAASAESRALQTRMNPHFCSML
jgi:hypothetical protein